jgi:hypothetical protein
MPLHPLETEATKDVYKMFGDEFVLALAHAAELMQSKGEVYDQLEPVWHRMPFGILSYVDELSRKTGRAIALVGSGGELFGDSGVEGSLMDAIVYAAFGIAWLRSGGEGKLP